MIEVFDLIFLVFEAINILNLSHIRLFTSFLECYDYLVQWNLIVIKSHQSTADEIRSMKVSYLVGT